MRLATRKILAAIAATGALLAAAACGNSSDTASSATSAVGDAVGGAASSVTGGASSSASSTGAYKAGTYDAEGEYTNPAGKGQVKVEVTIDDAGTVNAVTVTPEATGGNSLQFQTQFASGISAEVVGKKIDTLNVGKVSGSSLTGNGFNAAIKEIVSEAKA